MKEYISLIRGINVGGKTLKMDDLSGIYKSCSLSDVETYIQSGNVLFNSNNNDIEKLKSEIEIKIKKASGFDVTVFIKKRGEFEKIIEQNPFMKNKRYEIDKLHVTFLDKKPDENQIKEQGSEMKGGDDYKIIGSAIYLYCPGGYGKTKLTNNYFEKSLKVRATTRNWKTVTKLFELASEE